MNTILEQEIIINLVKNTEPILVSTEPTESIVIEHSLNNIIETVIEPPMNTLIEHSLNTIIETVKTELVKTELVNTVVETVKESIPVSTLNSIIDSTKPNTTEPITPITPNIMLNNLEELTTYVKTTMCGSGKITSLNIISILNNLLHVVEQYNTLSGSQKKMLVLDTLKKVVNEQYGNSPEDLLEKQILFILIDNTVPHFIDTLVSSINGKIKFIKSKETNCFTALKNIFSCKK